MIKARLITLLIFSFFLPLENSAQDIAVLLSDARKSEAAYQDTLALQQYLRISQLVPNDITVLCKISELYSKVGKRQPTKENQKTYFKTARVYAERALILNSNFAEANFVMALAMGRMAIIESGERRINAVKDIKKYAEKCIQSDPNNFKGYNVLGKWHYEVSNLSAIERWLVRITYGSLPPSSLSESIRYYEKSRSLKPEFVLNYLELAKAYHRNDEDKRAIAMLETMMRMPNNFADDPAIKAEGTKLLNQWR